MLLSFGMKGSKLPIKEHREKHPSSARTVRLLLADDHALFRQSCRNLLEHEPELQVVGDVATGRAAVAGVEKLRPDIALIDISMPDMDGLTATEMIMKTLPTPVVILTMHRRADYLLRAARAGAYAYIPKDDGGDVLTASIRRIVQGEHLLTPRQVRRHLRRFEHTNLVLPSLEARDDLTNREIKILKWVAQGATNREIASALNVKEKTVRNYLWQLSGKLQLNNRTQVALYALRTGIASLVRETRL